MKASLTKRNIVLMLISDVTSTYGSTVFNLAMMWFIYSETGSAFGASVIAALSMIAMVVASPLAGVLVDRFDPVKLLRLALLSASILLGILFVSSLYVEGLTLVFIIYAVVFLLYLAYSITNPAENKVVPNIVSKDKVASLYGMKSSTSQLSSLAGNASSGFLITLFSLAGSILINSVAFLFSALALTFIRVLKPFDTEAVQEERPSMRTQMRQGVEAIKDHPVLKKIALLCIVINIASFGPLLVVLTSSQYGG
ncbi:MFS transporter, partial [Rossellomorea marisflavi]